MTQIKSPEEIFNLHAKDKMVEFDLNKFKRSHPSLFAAIMASMVSAASQQAGSRWVREKPVFNDEAVFVAASKAKYWCYTLFQMVWTDGVNEMDEDCRYLALCDDSGEEWGDYADLKADKYFIISDEVAPSREQQYREALLKVRKKSVNSEWCIDVGIVEIIDKAFGIDKFYRYKCNHCGRNFGEKCHHTCNHGFRKRNHDWIDLSE